MKSSNTDFRVRRIGLAAVLAGAAGAATGQGTAIIDPSATGPKWVGWGTSIAWWGNYVGEWSDDPMFDQIMDDMFGEVDGPNGGLGLTIVRYNIGAGQNPSFPDDYMVVGRLMPSYKSSATAPYDFGADINQQKVLMGALERDVTHVEINANSPPWWMTISQDSSGRAAGQNIASSNFDDFAEYLATVTRYFRDELGVHASSLTPLNEPSARWWDGDGNQEGCTIFPSSQAQLLPILRDELDAAGLPEVEVSGPEEWSTGLTHDSVASYPSSVQQMMSHITTHTYSGGKEAQLVDLARQLRKPLWATEYGNGGGDAFGSAITYAAAVVEDLKTLPTLEAWCLWQTVVTTELSFLNWGMLVTSGGNPFPVYITKQQYHTYAQFTRHIRPGSRFIESGSDSAVASYDPARERLTIVVVNDTAAPLGQTFDLTGFESFGSTATASQTRSSANQQVLGSVAIASPGTLSSVATPNSVTTYVIEGVRSSGASADDYNLDGDVGAPDVVVFLADLAGDADKADLTGDYKTDAFDMIELMQDLAVAPEVAADPGDIRYSETFDAGEDNGDYGETGGGNNDAGYYFGGETLFVQSFASSGQEGFARFPLTGVTLEAGKTYSLTLRAGDFNQNWTSGGSVLFGVDGGSAGLTGQPSVASREFTVEQNNGAAPIEFRKRVLTFVSQQTVTDPAILIRTSGDQQNQRVAISSVTLVEQPG